MYLAKDKKRLVSSGVIKGAGVEAKICGLSIMALGGDATVSLYDAQGTTLAEKFFSIHLQPGTGDYFPLSYYCRNGGYVEITGTAEVFVHFV